MKMMDVVEVRRVVAAAAVEEEFRAKAVTGLCARASWPVKSRQTRYKRVVKDGERDALGCIWKICCQTSESCEKIVIGNLRF